MDKFWEIYMIVLGVLLALNFSLDVLRSLGY